MEIISLSKANRKLSNRNKNIIFSLTMAAIAVFVLWRCQFGFAQSDEFLHISIPYRMFQGDALLAEEWHQTQLTGFVYYPVTALILSVLGSSEGIVIWSRVACVLLELMTAVFIYCRLKKFSWAGAFIAAVMFALYTPVALTSVFYYTVGIMTMVITTVLIATADKHLNKDYFIAGVAMAASVLSFPHAAVMYFLYGAAVIFVHIRNRKNKTYTYGGREYLSLKMFMWFTAGVASLAVVFAAYIVAFVPIDKLLMSVKPIMIDEHHNITFLFKIVVYFGSMVLYNSKIVAVLMAALLAEMVFRKKFGDHIYFIAAAVMAVLLQVHILVFNHQIDYFMFAPSCFGIFCALLSKNSNVKRLFYTVYIPGIVYTFFLNLSSNQGFVAVSAAATVSTVASVVMAAVYFKELTENLSENRLKRICAAALCCFFAVQIAFQGYSRYTSIYGFGDIANQNIKLEYGVMKGLSVDKEHAEDYNEYYRIVETAQNNYNYEKVLTATKRTWMSFMFEKEICSFSAYINHIDEEFMTKQAMYFEVNPHKMPDIVFVQKEDAHFNEWFLSEYSGYSIDEYDFGYIIYKDGCKK